MSLYNAYESKDMNCILGDTLRPGGFELTDKAVEFCRFSKGDRILDIGCGKGATVEHIKRCFGIESYGIDPSSILIGQGKIKNPNLNIMEGKGENIPFENESMNGIFAECTLSLMDDLAKTIGEAYRVLKKDGWFVITDVYAKNPGYINLLRDFSLNSCMRGLHDIKKLKENMERNFFEIKLFEDHTDLLKKIMVDIIFKYGSMSVFWNKAACCDIGGTDCSGFQKVLSKCKVGYFMIIAKKGDD